jgi:hypothetical protein
MGGGSHPFKKRPAELSFEALDDAQHSDNEKVLVEALDSA